MTEQYSEDVQRCLAGAIDMHVHSAPDVMPRKGNDIEFAKRARAAGMGGLVLKSHHVPTADRATLVNAMVPGVTLYGSIALNNFVGGINPQAVEVAARLGCKVVWLPTVDAANEAGKIHQQDPAKLPYWAKIHQELLAGGYLRPPIPVVNDAGQLTAEVQDVLDLIHGHEMVLATGHLSPRESFVVIRAGRERHVERIVVTHPEFPTTRFSVAEQRELMPLGVYFERCYTTPATGKVSWDDMIEAIRATGPAQNIISTDLGQPQALFPDVGLADFAGRLLQREFSVDEVHRMTADNPRTLLQ